MPSADHSNHHARRPRVQRVLDRIIPSPRLFHPERLEIHPPIALHERKIDACETADPEAALETTFPHRWLTPTQYPSNAHRGPKIVPVQCVMSSSSSASRVARVHRCRPRSHRQSSVVGRSSSRCFRPRSASRAASRRLPRLVAFARVPSPPTPARRTHHRASFPLVSSPRARARIRARRTRGTAVTRHRPLLPLLQLLQQLKRPRATTSTPARAEHITPRGSSTRARSPSRSRLARRNVSTMTLFQDIVCKSQHTKRIPRAVPPRAVPPTSPTSPRASSTLFVSSHLTLANARCASSYADPTPTPTPNASAATRARAVRARASPPRAFPRARRNTRDEDRRPPRAPPRRRTASTRRRTP